MKLPLFFIVIATQVAFSQSALGPVDMIAKYKGPGRVLKITAGEVVVAGAHLKRLEIGNASAVVTYSNQTDQPGKPQFSARVFNAYGMEIGQFKGRWLVAQLQPGEMKQENASFYVMELEPAFSYTGIKLPADWKTPVFVVLDGASVALVPSKPAGL